MVDKFADADSLVKLRHPAKMIAVPMSGDQVIDLPKFGIVRRRHYATGIPRSSRPRISRIDQLALNPVIS